MGAKAIMLANPYTYKFLKGLTHSAVMQIFQGTHERKFMQSAGVPLSRYLLKPVLASSADGIKSQLWKRGLSLQL